ncbi:MAG: hypothetical protein WAL32_01835 [Terriglobales bacterium]
MSTFVKLLPPTMLDEVADPTVPDVEVAVEQEDAPPLHATGWTLASFAQEQIRGLVRQIFLPGWPRPCRQVVFSPVDQGPDIGPICMQVGQTLADEGSGVACVVEACRSGREVGETRKDRLGPVAGEKRFGTLRDSSQQLSASLWFMPRSVFIGGSENNLSPAWLRARLAELRLEFDYTVLQGPAAGAGSEAALLGATCDGMVLVLQANATRRATAQRVKETLHSANARLLGTVLSERTFPIPSSLYRRL